jgi:hypothetical protein
MIRRRRRTAREIEFSFDSFLDVVANVVGIILRLILVAWVGARSYKAVAPAPPPPVTLTAEDLAALPDPQDPLASEVERQRRELADAQSQLLEQLKDWQKNQQQTTLTAEELAKLTALCQEAAAERQSLETKAAQGDRSVRTAALSLAEIRERMQRVTAEIDALRKAPLAKQTLRYQTPVSHPLQTDELLFECQHGRVCLVDIGRFMEDIHRAVDDSDKLRVLRSMGRYTDVTPPSGGFRLRYTLETNSSSMQGACECSWEVEPVAVDRGETADAALAAGSEFRRIIDNIEPQQTAVTLCVYPDSFPLYRRLRDYLHERDIVVAGRAFPLGASISASRHGTASRGQ